MTKTVTLLHVSNTLNYGSMMMGENFIYHVAHRAAVPIRFQVTTLRPQETRDRLTRALGGKVDDRCVTAVDEPMIRNAGKARNLFLIASGLKAREFVAPWVGQSDMVAVLGGDDFTESYGYRGPLLELTLFRILKYVGIPVVMVGQTIGPFRSWRAPLARLLLRHVSLIIAREPFTYQYLRRRFGLQNVELGADLAFAKLAREDDDLGLILPDEYFCVVPSELLWRYGLKPSREAYLRALAGISRALLQMCPGAHLVLLPHVLAPDVSDDRRAARDLYRLLVEDRAVRERIHLVEGELLPYQARGILGRALLTVTGRMHAAISSLVRGRLAISLAYSEKYDAIIGQYLRLPELVVDVRRVSWCEVERTVIEKVRTLMNSPDPVVTKVRQAVTLMQGRVDAMMELVAQRFLKESSAL